MKHYEDYIARLHQIPRAFEQTIEVLRQGEKDGLMPVGFCSNRYQLSAKEPFRSTFLTPTKKFPASITAEDQKRLTEKIEQAVNSDVLPAINISGFRRKDSSPRTTIGLNSFRMVLDGTIQR